MNDSVQRLIEEIPKNVKLIAVSKTRTVQEIMEVYNQGIRDFGENKVQELINKQPILPKDIRWHLIGHLQTNKVKYIIPFVSLIHSVDSLKLLKEINQQAVKSSMVINCLLQIYIASEETKYGLTFDEAQEILASAEFKKLSNVKIIGLMGMASFTDDSVKIRAEFRLLKDFFLKVKNDFFTEIDYFKEISMGMSSDYQIAIEEGTTIVRIGTTIFGKRNYNKD